MEEETENFYIDLCVKSLANAEQYLKDSQLLFESDSFGHACSLAILGFEELAKVWCAYDLYMGFYQEQDDEIQLLLYDHKQKHQLTWENLEVLVLGELFANIIDIKSLFESSNATSDEKKQLISFFEEVIHPRKLTKEEIGNFTQAIKKLKELKEVFQKDRDTLEKIRWKGFYVNFNLKKKEITYTPQSFDKNISNKFINLLSDILLFTNNFLNEIIRNLKNPEVQKAIRKIRANAVIIRELIEKHRFDTKMSRKEN